MLQGVVAAIKFDGSFNKPRRRRMVPILGVRFS